MNVPGLVLHPTASAQLDGCSVAPAHAVLLSGPKGSGKTHIAVSLAAQLLAVDVAALEHEAYYRRVMPKDASISIDQIRQLLGFFRLTVPGGGVIQRVATIEDADSMGVEAQNALLKLLEEPPQGSVLLLTSSQPGRLLPTIRSRTQAVQLPSPDKAALTQHFMAAGHEAATISSVLARAGTNVAEAVRLLGGDAADDTVTLVKQALGGSTYDRLLLVDGALKQKEVASAFVDTLAAIAVASLEAAANKGASSLLRWQGILEVTHTAQEALIRNGNTKLVLTELMLAL